MRALGLRRRLPVDPPQAGEGTVWHCQSSLSRLSSQHVLAGSAIFKLTFLAYD